MQRLTAALTSWRFLLAIAAFGLAVSCSSNDEGSPPHGVPPSRGGSGGRAVGGAAGSDAGQSGEGGAGSPSDGGTGASSGGTMAIAQAGDPGQTPWPELGGSGGYANGGSSGRGGAGAGGAAGSSQGGAGNAAGAGRGGAAGGAGTSGAGGTVSPPANCNTVNAALAPVATAVRDATGSPPTTSGGPLTEGLYYLTQVTVYGAGADCDDSLTAYNDFRYVLSFDASSSTDGTVEMVSSSAGDATEFTFGYALDSGSLAMTPTCGGGEPTSAPYTATSSTLLLDFGGSCPTTFELSLQP